MYWSRRRGGGDPLALTNLYGSGQLRFPADLFGPGRHWSLVDPSGFGRHSWLLVLFACTTFSIYVFLRR